MGNSLHLSVPASAKPFYARLGFQITAGIVLGVVLGFGAPHLGTSMKVLGDIFLRLIKMVVAPLVFLNVALGIVDTRFLVFDVSVAFLFVYLAYRALEGRRWQ